jgi:hypothetical protein
MNAVGFLFTLLLPETKGLSLEEMDVLFKVVDKSVRQNDIEQHLGSLQHNERGLVDSPAPSRVG